MLELRHWSFEMDTRFSPIETSSGPNKNNGRRKRLLIVSCAAVVGVLIVIHHIRLEIAASRDSAPRGEPGIMEGPEGSVGRTGSAGSGGPRDAPAFVGLLANGTLADQVSFNERKLNSIMSSLGWDNCGGLIEMKKPVQEIRYELPPGGARVNCVWVVTLESIGSVRLSLVEGTLLDFDHALTLVVFKLDGSGCDFTVPLPRNGEVTVSSQLFFAYFMIQASRENQIEGFRLRMTAIDNGGRKPWRFMYSEQTNSFAYKYPPFASAYQDDSKFLLLAHPIEGKKANVTVYDIHTERDHDQVMLIHADPDLRFGHFCESRSGNNASDIAAKVPSGQPFVIYFESNGNGTERGFMVNGSYYT